MMGFLKRNLFVIICLLVGLGSLGLGQLACMSRDSITKSLDQASGFGTQLAGAGVVSGRKEPIVPIDIAVQQQNKQTMQGAIQEVLQTALVVNETGLDYLLPEAFPDQMSRPKILLKFIQRYEAGIRALPEILDAKGPPTSEDIAEMQRVIDDENAEMGVETRRTSTPRAASVAPRQRTGRQDHKKLGGLAMARALEQSRAGRIAPMPRVKPKGKIAQAAKGEEPISKEELLRTDATRRAQLKRAESIKCYVDNDPYTTFTMISSACDPGADKDPNLPMVLWRAQVTYWVQREICHSLGMVNEDAAKALKAKDPSARTDVTTLPIKRLIRLAVGNYRAEGPPEEEPKEEGRGRRPPSRRAPRRGARSARPAGGGGGVGNLSAAFGGARRERERETPGQVSLKAGLTGPSWTGRQGGASLDVVPVAMRLVMDVRYLPHVIDAVCRVNFVVPTRVSYRKLDRSDLQESYVYGPAPLVEATLVFERYYFPKVYAEKMPPKVHEWLGHPVLGDDEEEPRGKRGRSRDRGSSRRRRRS